MDEKDVQHTEDELDTTAVAEDEETPDVEGHIKTSAPEGAEADKFKFQKDKF